MVEQAGIVDFVDEKLKELRKGPGRQRSLSVHALFVGAALAARQGRFFVAQAVDVLNGLDGRTRRRLGANPTTGSPVTHRQAYYLLDQIALALGKDLPTTDIKDEDRYAVFDHVFSAISRSGRHSDTAKSASIAIDGTEIETWGTRKNVYVHGTDDEDGEEKWTKMRRVTDPDAAYRGSRDHDYKDPVFGYEVSVAVSVRDVDVDDAVRGVVAARFRPANVNARTVALSLVEEVRNLHGTIGDVLVDREYTQQNDGQDFLLPLRRMGAEPVFDFKSTQIGPRGMVHGAVIIEGRPYSPSLPEALRNITPPRSKGTDTYKPSPQAVEEYQQRIAAREIYAMVPHGAPNVDKGTFTFQCPSAAGRLRCPIQAPRGATRAGLLPAANPPIRELVLKGTVCDKRYKTFSFEDLPLYQRDVYGSKEWARSYARRGGNVESFFAAIKDEAAEGIRRGRIRVRGLVKTGLAVAFAIASANVRLARAWDRRAHSSTKKRKVGRPAAQRLTTFEPLEGQAVVTPLRV